MNSNILAFYVLTYWYTVRGACKDTKELLLSVKYNSIKQVDSSLSKNSALYMSTVNLLLTMMSQ